jgi:penicillin-binding protein 1B
MASRRAQIWRSLDDFPKPSWTRCCREDRRFFRHGGIDLWAVIRAGVTNLRQDGIRQGGSTITQQLARTLFLSGERVWGRKAREAALALLIECRYSKRRILEAYLNTIYLGHDGDVAVHGLPAAARHFLRKDLAAVRPDEAALLAAAIAALPFCRRVRPRPTGRTRSSRRWSAGPSTPPGAREALARLLERPLTISSMPLFRGVGRDEIRR